METSTTKWDLAVYVLNRYWSCLRIVQRTQRGSIAGTGYDVRTRREATFRQTENLYYNDDIEFYIGLLFDGVPTYRNVSEALPKQGKMNIYRNLRVYEFEEEVLDFRHNDEHIVIKVIRSSNS